MHQHKYTLTIKFDDKDTYKALYDMFIREYAGEYYRLKQDYDLVIEDLNDRVATAELTEHYVLPGGK